MKDDFLEKQENGFSLLASYCASEGFIVHSTEKDEVTGEYYLVTTTTRENGEIIISKTPAKHWRG